MAIICIDKTIKKLRECRFDIKNTRVVNDCPPLIAGEHHDCLFCEFATITEDGVRRKEELVQSLVDATTENLSGLMGDAVIECWVDRLGAEEGRRQKETLLETHINAATKNLSGPCADAVREKLEERFSDED